MPVVGNRIKVASSSTGTGNITLGSAEDGFQTFADGGISNNDVVRYVITEGSSFEIGKGTYLTSGPTLTRTSGNLLESSTGSLLNLGGSATVFVSLADVDVMQTDGGTFAGDVTFTGDSYNALWDKSQDALHFNDRATLSFGGNSTAPDMWIEHNNALNLNRIRGSDITIQDYDGSNVAVFQEDAGAALYHNGSLKAEIVSTGLDISSGDIRFGGSADEKVGSSSSRTFLTGNLGSQLRAGNNTKVAATTTGVELTGATVQDGDFTFTGASYNAVWDKSDNALEFADNAELRFGAGNDFKIFHNGSQTYLSEEGTGDLRIRGGNLRLHSPNDEPYLVATANGAVTIYYDNSAKLATTSAGIDVTGTAVTDGLTVAGNVSVDSGTIKLDGDYPVGTENVALGDTALDSVETTATWNTAIGSKALTALTTGDGNVAVGQTAAQSVTTGSYNTAIGRASLLDNTTGSNNTAVGMRALQDNTVS